MSYEIEIHRIWQDSGILRFLNGSQTLLLAQCWWDPAVPIPSKRYTRCSATYMARAYHLKSDGKINWRKRKDGTEWQGIFLPDTQTGHKGIFIHKGTSAGWSDGCIVLPYDQLMQMWNAINPKDGRNVTVDVFDVVLGEEIEIKM